MSERSKRFASPVLVFAALAIAPACGGGSNEPSGGNGGGRPPGASCSANADCASYLCTVNHICANTVPGSGFGGSPGSVGTGSSGNTSTGSTGSTTTQPPGFTGTPGSTGFRGLTPGCGPETAKQC